MRKFLIIVILLCIEKSLHAQQPFIYSIKADSVKITNTCDTAELIIENHTQNVPGFLYNKGRGRTEFRRAVKLNDSTLVLGDDTIIIQGNIIADNGLSIDGKSVQLGQSVGAINDPAALKSNREIPMEGFDVRFKNINDTGCLKLYTSPTKTVTSPIIQFLDGYGTELGRISFFDTANNANMMIGRKAGSAQIAGAIRNTFIGFEAGKSVTSGSRNTAVGHRALTLATTGSGNVAVGGFTLESLTTGSNNFAFGYTSATSLTTGSNNICIGGSQVVTSALQKLKTGNNNLAIGIGALAEAGVTTSNFSDNIGIGFKCFYSNTLGNRNIGIGDSLCTNSLVGADNVLLGSKSISNGSQVGNANVIMGAGLISSGGAIGNNNIILGANFTTTSSVTNTVIIGQGITNNQSNIVRLGKSDQNVIIGATSNQTDNGNRVQILGTAFISDTLKMPNIVAQTDTANCKPVVVDANGNVFKMAGWNLPQITRTPVNDAGYSALASDYLIAFTALTAARTVTLPAASSMTNRIMIIKDESGAATTYNITINVTAGGTIDGASSKTISVNYGSIEVYSNGSQWFTK
ncbi:hypothetical protein FAM09_12890 [Niastella caeni]|uniref:Trimeric autotransporter adhesin YadA-like head domain-containing protein n=1 Tax=Niastella caeni TaxID=2569763 RepID=A0A4S8HUX6_9BACT|nr:hypothetical protein [Niastella caeni]THU39397.1 hypothetical protein FAM09_12890 [Niastella caeni]